MTKDAKTEAVDDPVGRARAVPSRLNTQELGMALLYRQKAAELAAERAKRGDQVLDASDPTVAARDAGRRVTAMLEELEALADASRRARERRLSSIPAVYQAAAAERERRAGELEAEATKLEAESRKLREALEAHDQWAYFAAEGVVDGRPFSTVPHNNGEFRLVDARGPVFKQRLTEARILRAEAEQHRLRKPEQAGMWEADTVEDLLAAVHVDPMRIGPPIDAIVAWAEAAIEKERRRRERMANNVQDDFVPRDAPTRLHLEWRSGVIDEAGSRIVRPELGAQVAAYADSAELAKVGGPLSEDEEALV
jgi:hypothetical protein